MGCTASNAHASCNSVSSHSSPLPVKSHINGSAPKHDKSDLPVSIPASSTEENDDPFANISDAGDDDEEISARKEPTAGVVTALSSIDLFAEESDGENGDEELDALEDGKRLNSMAQDTHYSYFGNKLTEISQVKQQALHLKETLNLFYNSSLVRALMEVLQAKEIQVTRARDAGDLTPEALTVLLNNIAEVRTVIAQAVNSNTVRVARRMMKRTRSLGNAFEDTEISVSEDSAGASYSRSDTIGNRPSSVSSTSAFEIHDFALQSSLPGASALHGLLTSRPLLPQRTVTTPLVAHTRGVASTSTASSAMADLLSVCEKESFGVLLTSLKNDMVHMARSINNPSLAEYVEKQWDKATSNPINNDSQLSSSQASLYYIQSQLLERCSETIELFHPGSAAFREIRRKVKECVLTFEMAELQRAAHSKLDGRSI